MNTRLYGILVVAVTLLSLGWVVSANAGVPASYTGVSVEEDADIMLGSADDKKRVEGSAEDLDLKAPPGEDVRDVMRDARPSPEGSTAINSRITLFASICTAIIFAVWYFRTTG